MRTVKIGEADVELLGSAYSSIAWHTAFGEADGDLLSALIRMEGSKLPRVADGLRVAWALMASAARVSGGTVPSFDAWIDSLGALDGFEWFAGVIDEADAGFFRSAHEKGKARRAKRKPAARAGGDGGKADGAEL